MPASMLVSCNNLHTSILSIIKMQQCLFQIPIQIFDEQISTMAGNTRLTAIASLKPVYSNLAIAAKSVCCATKRLQPLSQSPLTIFATLLDG